MSIVLPLTSFFRVEDLSREVASTAIDRTRGHVRLVKKLSQTFTQPFNLSALIPIKENKITVLFLTAKPKHFV
jgi:hypothetical protein